MVKKEFNKKLFNTLESSVTSYNAVSYIKKVLETSDFIELKENKKWNIKSGKFYVTRNDASIVAFELPGEIKDIFSIVTTHCDTPSLLLKPNGEYIKDGYLKLNIMPYGGLLNYGWLDQPLSIAGRIIYKENSKLKVKIIDFEDTELVVPSVAIHQNNQANANLDLNMQIDLQPLVALSKSKDDWNKYLCKKCKVNNIIDYDLHLYNSSKPKLFGINKEFLLSPRIDNITSVYSALESFVSSKSKSIKVFCSFNNEEIGSLTEEGADSNFLIDVLKRICASINIDIAVALSKSFIISSDNTHAIHPNHKEYADDTGALYLGKGLAIIKEISSTTNSISSSIIKEICDINKIKYQDATSKNDLSSGSALSGISLRHLSVLSVDVGIPQLAMHSSIEVCSLDDIYELYRLMKSFYEAEINIDGDKVKINSNREKKISAKK